MTELHVLIIEEDFPRKEEPIAGKTSLEWIESSLGDLPFTVTREIAKPLPDARYIAAVPRSLALMEREYLLSCVKELEKRSISVAELGRGKIARREAFFEEPKIAFHSVCLTDLAESGNREKAETLLSERIARRLQEEGVILEDPSLVKISANCVVEKGARIEAFVKLERSIVRSGAVIRSFSTLVGSEVAEGAEVIESRVYDSVIGKGAKVGPFAYIRMGSAIGEKCRIGDFVEVKASFVADGAKAAHLTYIGDAEIGVKTNIGCGAVFANYDGKNKHKTKVGNEAFIGANVNLIAPVTVGDGAFIAAATTVTKNVSDGAFVIGRSRAEEKERKKK